MNKIIACIDGSALAKAVCETAIWASKRLSNGILFLHTIEKQQQHGADDLTGSIGLGARSALLNKMAELDEQRGKIEIQLGNDMLDAAVNSAKSAGLTDIEHKQQHGDFVDALVALEADARLMVVGRSGDGHQGDFKALGYHIETLIRQVHTSIIIAPKDFIEPTNFMLAYDGRETADTVVQRIIQGGLLKGLICHLVTIKNSEDAHKEKFEQAQELLKQEGFKVIASYIEGDISSSLMNYKKEHDIQLVAMGAFSHSKVRSFFLGSNTMRMIENCRVPLIVLR
ncbi:UspA-related nucleotide-binding protein [Moritella sp. JT01]|uniref:universal stress protein n=1 Tax=Moritella sp. JT01 TaxID=756698 RepID=UPI000794C406|nr:universal stress protein [Moritella sp. JT01]KXO07368.1 UspA-related nucleotide-binding protein [Moritella sp. JT01]